MRTIYLRIPDACCEHENTCPYLLLQKYVCYCTLFKEVLFVYDGCIETCQACLKAGGENL